MLNPILALGRELVGRGPSQTDLCLATGLPSWKISRLLKRAELRGLVSVKVEDRRVPGRPRKFYELTADGERHLGIEAEGE